MSAKKCPICDSADLQYVYYAPSAKDEPTLWEDMIDIGYSPRILFKRIECKKCGASVPGLTMTLDDALLYWNSINDKTNHRYVLQRIGTENVAEEKWSAKDGLTTPIGTKRKTLFLPLPPSSRQRRASDGL